MKRKEYIVEVYNSRSDHPTRLQVRAEDPQDAAQQVTGADTVSVVVAEIVARFGVNRTLRRV